MQDPLISYRTGREEQAQQATVADYLALLEQNADALFEGSFAIYLAPRVMVDGKAYFFPMLSVAGYYDKDIKAWVAGTLFSACRTMETLSKLKADRLFKAIATGDNRCLLVSNRLLPIAYFKAFALFVRLDLPPMIEKDFPGRPEQTAPLFEFIENPFELWQEGPTHAHPLPNAWNGILPEEFIGLTRGYPDGSRIISFMKWLLKVEPIDDLATLEDFGGKLIEYRQKLESRHIFPFTPPNRVIKPVSAIQVFEALKARGMEAKIETRQDISFISFKKLPCPSCGRSDANASAYPPSFALKCFNSRCEACQAKEGLPLLKWAGIVNEYERRESATSQMVYVRPPARFQTLAQARRLIRKGMASEKDVLCLVTPGVGKTQEALKYLVTRTDKVILYSCLNRQLKDEAFQKCLSFARACRAAKKPAFPDSRICNMKAREDLCLEPEELKKVTRQGYSPAMILCRNCKSKDICQYAKQKKRGFRSGIYFVTHAMLEYLEKDVPEPDLIVLDENIVKGFVTDISSSESDMRSLLAVLKDDDADFVKELITAGSDFAAQVVSGGQRYLQIVNGRRVSCWDISQDTVLDIYARRRMINDFEVRCALDKAIEAINSFASRELYDRNVNLKAVNWLRGLSADYSKLFSFIEASPSGVVSFKIKRINPLGFDRSPIKILDATSHPKIAQAMTGTGRSFEVVRADVRWQSRLVHIRQKINRYNLATLKPSELEDLVKKGIEKTGKASKVLVVTHAKVNNLPLGQNVLGICRAEAPEKEFALHTFFGPRGINSFEDCQALFILGSPIPNINAVCQEAAILFPHPGEEEIRDAWVDLSTNWELIQCLHRVRPVHKKSTELVLAADSWPICLPEPEIVQDESRDTDKPERLLKRLKIFFDELGFMNRDLALIAKVYQPGKTEKIYRDITRHLGEVTNQKGETRPRSALFSPPLKSYPADKINNKGEAYLLKNTIGKHTLFEPTMLIVAKRLREQLCAAEIPVTARQLKAVLDQLEADGGFFDRFTVKSGYGKGQKIAGVGLIDRVEAFYKELNALESSPNTNMESIVREARGGEGYQQLPKGEIVVTLSEYAQDIIRLGYSNKMAETTPEGLLERLGTIINEIQHENEGQPISIITTQGKLIAALLIGSEQQDIPIKDLTAIERILQNNLIGFRRLTQSSLMGRYEREAASPVIFKGLSDIWNLQSEAIKNDGLEKVMALEEKMLRVMADMERHGIGVDVEKLNEMIESHAFPQYEKAADAILGRVGEDGRFHDDIDFMGATSARLVSKLDNVPRKGPLRSFFKAREGYRFIVADYRQQEPRIMAGLSEDKAMKNIFRTGQDIYGLEAGAIIAKLGRNVERDTAKNINRSMIYFHF